MKGSFKATDAFGTWYCIALALGSIEKDLFTVTNGMHSLKPRKLPVALLVRLVTIKAKLWHLYQGLGEYNVTSEGAYSFSSVHAANLTKDIQKVE